VGVLIIAYGTNLIFITRGSKPAQLTVKGQEQGQAGISAYTQQIQDTGLGGGGDERSQARMQAWHLFLDHPILGVGPGNFGPQIQNNQGAGGWAIVNNETLELMAETGIVGFILFLAYLATLVIQALRRLFDGADAETKLWLAGLLAFLGGIIIQYQTFSTLYIMHFWTALGILMGLAYAAKRETSS
jgi:O-antigen ligase